MALGRCPPSAFPDCHGVLAALTVYPRSSEIDSGGQEEVCHASDV